VDSTARKMKIKDVSMPSKSCEAVKMTSYSPAKTEIQKTAMHRTIV
jgi:hypothetical protein